MQTVGIIANCQREAAVACARSQLQYLRERGVGVRLPEDLAGVVDASLAGDDAAVGSAELVLALGGDGTLLAANRMAAPHQTPILGVHVGGPASFGFLTETTPSDAQAAVDAVLSSRYAVEERLMVCAEITRDGECLRRYHGLNDLVIRAQSRMLKMRVEIGGTFIATYAADGIIVATPTGSTAYNLAAGGPVVHPCVESILLTPICPHTLNVRSLLIGVDHSVRVRLESTHRDVSLLTIDGQISVALEPYDEVLFYRSELRGRFVVLDGAGFYHKVQKRLRLGERF